MKIQSWSEARMLAKSLKDWLSQHCPECGRRFTKNSICGGRCTQCGKTIIAEKNLSKLIKDATFLIDQS